MKALVLTKPGQLEIIETPKPALQPGEVLIKMSAAALNKRDQFIREGKYPNIQINAVLGSDGAGEVIELSDGVDSSWKGKMVLINPNMNWGESLAAQGREYAILGMPSNGTMAEYIAVPHDRIHAIPEHLKPEEAAAIPLGGLTAYRACFTHGKIKQNENVLISGFGGGVAQFAFQFAMEACGNVFITSSKKDKIDKAIEMGASGGFNYKDPDWYKNPWQTKGGFDVVIDSAGGNQINNFIKIMRPAGRIVFYGATNGLPSSIDLYRMFWNQITLQGSTMGNDQEFTEMLHFISRRKINPVIDSTRPFDEVISAFDDLAKGDKLGKIVVKF